MIIVLYSFLALAADTQIVLEGTEKVNWLIKSKSTTTSFNSYRGNQSFARCTSGKSEHRYIWGHDDTQVGSASPIIKVFYNEIKNIKSLYSDNTCDI